MTPDIPEAQMPGLPNRPHLAGGGGYVGCAPGTTTNTAKREPEFARQIERATATCKFNSLQNIDAAGDCTRDLDHASMSQASAAICTLYSWLRHRVGRADGRCCGWGRAGSLEDHAYEQPLIRRCHLN